MPVLCSDRSWVLNEICMDHRSFFSLGRNVNVFIQISLFSKEVHFNSGVRRLLELPCVVVIKHVAFFTIRAKLTVAFTCTTLLLNLYNSVSGYGCGFGFGEKKKRIGGFAYSYSPPPAPLTLLCNRCQSLEKAHTRTHELGKTQC